MKKIVLLILMTASWLSAQQTLIDSLESSLTAADTVNRISILNDLSRAAPDGHDGAGAPEGGEIDPKSVHRPGSGGFTWRFAKSSANKGRATTGAVSIGER